MNRVSTSAFAGICLSACAFGMEASHALGETTATNDGSILRVITYNVQFLPEPVCWKNERPNPTYRARRIAEELRSFDLAALQEVFHERHRQQIIDQVRAGWGGALHQVVSPHPAGFHTSGGCLILSKRPVLESSSMVFANYSKPADFGLRADGHAAKGVLHARIARSGDEPDNFIDVFVTHLEARADDLRPQQYKELAAFIRERSDAGRPMLLLGDLNTYGTAEYQNDPSSQYSQLMRELGAARPDGGVIDLWPHLHGDARGGTTEQESADVGKRVDYIMLGNPRSSVVQLKPLRVDVELYQDAQVGALSDHNAVIAQLQWLAAAGQRAPQSQSGDDPRPAQAYATKRINKCIELLEQGQPIYYVDGGGGYEDGKKLAKTWADYIWYDMEHAPFDVARLRSFMQGLVDGGPTPSGHRTPAVIVTLPVLGVDAEMMKGGCWMVQQALACGIHGVHLCRARDPQAVRLFVQSTRYPHHKQAVDEIGEGLRGFGSHKFAADIWGVDEKTYFDLADVWPLNSKGEIMLGIKIEDRHALANAEKSIAVSGIAFAEWGPRDMGLSYGLLGGRADPPLPRVLQEAGERVLAECKAADVFFLDNVLPENVARRIDEGVMIGAGRLKESAEVGRRHTNRKMPW